MLTSKTDLAKEGSCEENEEEQVVSNKNIMRLVKIKLLRCSNEDLLLLIS